MIGYYSAHARRLKGVLEKQSDGRCMICSTKTALFIDHDHKTGKIRGVLCRSCNFGLGAFADTPELLRVAIAYLQDPPAFKVTLPRETKQPDLSWLPRVQNRIPNWVPKQIRDPKKFFGRSTKPS